MANPSALLVRQASLALGGRPILQGIDVELPRGQVLALLGGSGCGKTTLLRAIAGLQPLDTGAVHVDGRDISYNETNALAKEGEEALLYRDMETDIAQQMMRRLAALK